MKISIAHFGADPGVQFTYAENNFSDSAPLVSEIFIKGILATPEDPALMLAACILAAPYIGDVIELPYPVSVPFIDAIRVICPQVSSVGPSQANSRSVATGEVDCLVRRAAQTQTALGGEPLPMHNIEWHSDFVNPSGHHGSSGFAFGTVFTNATLVAQAHQVDLAVALCAYGSRLGSIRVPSLRAQHGAARMIDALERVAVQAKAW